MKKETLKSMPYAQAQIITNDDNSVTLISYTTAVCGFDKDGWFYINGLYSATTRKHISAFMRERCNSDYQMAKRCYNEYLTFNIHTGRIVSLETGEIIAM